MAVSFTGGSFQSNSSWGSVNTLTQSTATAFQELDLRFDATVLGMGTATGFGVNRYSLPTGGLDLVEGKEHAIVCNATGEAKVSIPLPSGRIGIVGSSLTVPAATAVDALWASATGLWVFQSDGDFLLLKYMNGSWAVIHGSGATQATAT